MMNLELNNRCCLVSGASEGMGAGIVRLLANNGVRVAATARRMDKLVALAELIKSEGGSAPVLIAADITQHGEAQRIVAEAEKALGHIDILANCVGGARAAGLDDGDDVWDESFAINFTATRRLTTTVLPAMRQRGWGRIISISGSMEPRALNASSAAKAALHLWSKGLSCSVAQEGITVNVIQPGRINSEQIRDRLHPTEASRQAFIDSNIPIGYFGEPEDIANLVVFLSSPMARYITGAVIPVDGGMHYFAH